MGQTQSSSLPLKRFVNEPREAVNDAIEGLLWTTPNLRVLEGFPEVKVVVRADWRRDGVAVVAGGGAGHEPTDVGMVGQGMLTAAVCGEIFTSPPADAVLQAVEAVTGPAGCIVITKNSMGNKLNFGAGVNEALKKGLLVRSILVADDLATARKVSGKPLDFKAARGMAGLQLVCKVAGAAAEAGLSLEEVYQEASAMANAVRTQGVGFSCCSIPGQTNKRAPISPDEMEIGMGIHGEPGVMRVKARNSAKEIIDTMVSQLTNAIPEDVPLCAMLNNLGAVPHLEMSILAAQVMRSEIAKRVQLFIGPAHLMTSLDTNGISLSLAPLNPLRAERLQAPTSSKYWVPAVVPLRPSIPGSRARSSMSMFPPSSNPKVSVLLLRACKAIEETEEELNKLDAQIANGDCGRNLAHAARLIRAAMPELPLNDPGPLFLCVAKLLRGAEGALSALTSIVFFEAGKFLNARDCKTWGPGVVEALNAAKQAVDEVTEVKEGTRSFMDALGPALRVAADGLSSMASAARKGARSTAFMPEAAGRAAYTSSTQRYGVPDVGAMAVALVLAAMAAPPCGSLRWTSDEDVHSSFQFGKVVGSGSFGVVHEAIDKSRESFAIKVTKRGEESGPDSFASLDFLAQRHMCNWLFCPKAHIVSIHEVLVSPSYVYIVMEHLQGPELSENLQEREQLTEKDVAKLARQMLMAIKHIHSFGLVHRDLKIENFRFADASATELKLVDVVGTMCFEPDDSSSKQVSGTLSYLAPEAIRGFVSQAVDMWAFGVILHWLLSGSFPYEEQDIQRRLQITQQPPAMDAPQWRDISKEAQLRVCKLLSFEADKRPSANDELESPWIRDCDNQPDNGPSILGMADGMQLPVQPFFSHTGKDHIEAVKTLYLVRHGEALHNIREREAKELAEMEARAHGQDDKKEIKLAGEKARQEALKDASFLDAPLSSAGRAMALDAQAELNRLTAQGFPEPSCILVSPLERALQTAAIIFPAHPCTHVSEALRERRTGLPCDERKPAGLLARRRTFCHMSFQNVFTSESDDCGFHRQITVDEVEDKPHVRSRATDFMEELRTYDDTALSVVTHKGFLRELERGPLGQDDATEFGNCEVRVYEVSFHEDGGLSCKLRYLHD